MLGNAANDPTIQAHSFKALAMNADGTEGWAVGDEQVAHYAHGAWSRISTPAVGLETVAMVPGTNEAYAGGTASGLYHYDGTSWSEVPGSSAWRQIGAIVFTGSNSGWATYLESIGSAGFLRFANGRWQPDSTAPQTKAPFTHFSMLSSGDGWAIQSGDMPVHIAARGTWKQFTDSWLEGYNSVAMVSPTDVWLVGTNALAGGDGLILHMLEDSKGWYTDDPNSLNVPDPDIKSATKSFGGNGFNDVSFSPSDHSTAWAVGQNGLVAQWTATSKTWTEQDSGTNDYLSAVYAVSPTEAWAVGGGPFFEQDSAVILHYKDGAWNPVVSKA